MGNFGAARIFFVNIPLAGIFFPYAGTFFLGYSPCMNFFHSIFPRMNFFCSSPTPPSPTHNFSYGPSLTKPDLAKILVVFPQIPEIRTNPRYNGHISTVPWRFMISAFNCVQFPCKRLKLIPGCLEYKTPKCDLLPL